ncbi:MAG: hemerythrin domain-containing protein [Segniliparus sp.]|uniref:hemerythrin domain-containing protein n=1 Tax=Segniliparus sp. TaxID=2804064 RepID=UPI003F2B4C03
MFRREFALMPRLVLDVATGDRDRAGVIGDHIAGITSFLHTHHVLEDDNVWPLLLDRCGESVASLMELMEAQHHQLAELIPQVDAAVSAWRDSPTAASRQALADVLDRLAPVLKEHLDTEEGLVVPLMEQRITAAEWTGFLKGESGSVDPDYAPLLLGMMMYEGDPESVEQVIATTSADTSPAIKELAASAFAAHSQRVHGTATPPRSTEL